MKKRRTITMENCLFCKIVKGEIPCMKVYEDNDFIAFEDIEPSNKGHTLIVPKEHSKNILEIKPEIGTKLIEVIKKISNAIEKGLDAKGINTIINTNEVAGQTIFHTHIHLIPRYENDGLKIFKKKEITEEERVIATEKIIKAMI